MSDDFAGLARKLRTLDLDDAEAGALRALLARARDAGTEVEGFGVPLGSLGFDTSPGAGRFKGSDEELAFKGSDEELQALVDWLAELPGSRT